MQTQDLQEFLELYGISAKEATKAINKVDLPEIVPSYWFKHVGKPALLKKYSKDFLTLNHLWQYKVSQESK